MTSLLEQAKKIQSGRKTQREITKQDIELALAWTRDEVSVTQIHKVIDGASGVGIYIFLAKALKQHVVNSK